MDWLYGAIGFIVVTAVLTIYMLIKRKQSWSGQVVDLATFTKTDQDGDFPEEYLKIKIKLANGKTIKKNYPKLWFLNQYPNGVHIGDRLVKNSGEEMFQIVS